MTISGLCVFFDDINIVRKFPHIFRFSASVSAKKEQMFLFFGPNETYFFVITHIVAAVCIHLIVLQKNGCQQNTHSLLNEHTV